jgi:hypothetical protein
MDFQQLLAKMKQLDQPVAENIPAQECGSPMGMTPPMGNPSMNDQPPPAHPSMSVNLNAQGMDNIESLLKLMTKVNPDMINQPAPMSMPPISPEPSIMSIKPPMPGIGDLGNLDSGPLKMLPNLDMDGPDDSHDEPDADNMGGPSDNDADNKIDMIQKSMGDNDGDGDHDMDDHDMEKDGKDDDAEDDKEDKKKDEWANGLTGHDDVDYKGMDAAVPDGNDLNKPKKTFPKVAGGDNPMQKDSFRESIRAELQRRLDEAKLSELSKDTLKSYKDKADAAVGKAAAADKDDGKFAKRFDGGMKAQAKLDKKGDK